MTYNKFIFKIFILFSIVINLQAQEEYNHPELEWHTFETDHFYFHYHKGTKRTALAVSKIAEDIYKPVTALYDYTPPVKFHFIIKDTDDYSNGGAYFFDDKIEIWAENLDYIMRGTKDWLRDVVTHEFTHMIQIQSSLKFNRNLPYGFIQVFGYESERRTDVVRGFPNVLVSYPVASVNLPVWYAEGVAQYQTDSSRYDYRDPNREMIIRDRIIYDQLLSFNELGVFGKTSHGNESAYNLGFSFVKYIADRFGEKAVGDISNKNSALKSLTFNQSLSAVTGVPADSLYLQWKQYLTDKYKSRLKIINKNMVAGQPVEKEGFSNLYPVWSPDNRYIAYLSNKGNDYFSQNKLILYDTISKEKKELSARISSSLSWSPDGRYLAYSRKTISNIYGSSFNNIFIYDVENKEEIKLSRNLRGKNPDWSHDGRKILYVGETNGLNQLFVFSIHENIEEDTWNTYAVDIETGTLQDDHNQEYSREVEIRGDSLRQLLKFEDGRQIYHPRWSPDDSRIVFDTATDYGRDIGIYNFSGNEFKIILDGKEEQRYPVWSGDGHSLYYSSAETGIYNLYKINLETSDKALLTNVSGGAVMPSVNSKNEIVYALYDSIGYHIYRLKNPDQINPELAHYQDDYIETIPDKNFDDSQLPEYKTSSYKQKFTHINFLPRLLFDYGTLKPGFYLFSSDVLNKMNLLAGAAVNAKADYDLFGIFEYREFYPTFFIEAYNMNVNIEDTLLFRIGENNFEEIDQDINFNLTEASFGAYAKIGNWLRWEIAYILSRYNAKIKWFDPGINELVTFRYSYLKGSALKMRFISDMIKPSRYSAINPSGGRYIFLSYAYEDNDFIENFDTGEIIGLEVFGKHAFNRIEMDYEEFFYNPLLKSHGLSFRLKAGYIDRPVDDFFNLFAGGLLGMKGYSYYSLEGRKSLISTFSYRFPIARNLDWQVFNTYFDNLYMGFFYDYGNAWIGDKISLTDFKRDVGVQLRLETFTNYLFPTRIFWEAAYPLDEAINQNVTYEQEWRFYFGVLFDFDFRERFANKKFFKFR